MVRQASAARAKKLFLESRYLIVGENVNQMLPSTSWDCGNTEGMWNCTSNTPTKRLIIASRNWRSISCFLMSSAPYGICLKWKQKCWVMLSWMRSACAGWCWVGCAGSGWVRSSNNNLDERNLRFLIQLQGTAERFWMRPKEWGRSQSESVRKYRCPQKFLAQKRSSLHFPLPRCWSRPTQIAPDFPTRECDRPTTANHHPSRSHRRGSWGRGRGSAHTRMNSLHAG